MLIALFFLHVDMKLLRASLIDVWKDYKAGKINFINASIITNTAREFAARIEMATVTSLPNPSKYESLLRSSLQASKSPEQSHGEDKELSDSGTPENSTYTSWNILTHGVIGSSTVKHV